MLKLGHKARHILVCGRSEWGKTSTLLAIINAEKERVFVFDPEGEFQTRLSRVHVTDEFDKMLGRSSRITCFSGEYEDFDDFCCWCFEFASRIKGSCLVVVDEVQLYLTTTQVPEPFLDCMIRGRKRGVDIVMATHQPNMLHNTLRPQITEIYALGISDTANAKFLEGFGVPTEELVDAPRLTPYHKIVGGELTIKRVDYRGKFLTNPKLLVKSDSDSPKEPQQQQINIIEQ